MVSTSGTNHDGSSSLSSATRGHLRRLPSVDALASAVMTTLADTPHIPVTREVVVEAVREVLARTRSAVLAGVDVPTLDMLAREVRQRVGERTAPALRPVINATGVIVNTNLGRSPLAAVAIDAVAAVAQGYSNLEFDLEDGERGSRQAHVRGLLRGLTGAEDALVVNNNASAVLVVLSALAADREVIVSRGELVEIGGGFRVPDVMRQSGARLVEVGTTNRTRLRDFEQAITERTSLLLSVHPSNFQVIGFTEAPDLAGLAQLAHAHGLPLVHDLGSGCFLPTEQWGLAHEPMPVESVTAGADIVCFSGDKLLGGPQAGIIVGRNAYLSRIAVHPLMRAVRIDKMTLAALEATLRLYRDGQAMIDIPIWQAISMSLESIEARATQWMRAVGEQGIEAHVTDARSTIGGGSLPGETLPTRVCAIPADQPDSHLDLDLLAARLREADPPVVTRVSRGRLLLDPRSVLPGQDAAVSSALTHTLSVVKNS